MKNLKPGTIIFDDVVESKSANFFMVSTKADFGTVIPTHYELILNQSKFSLEKIAKMTYELTYLYYNWMGSVKVPAMAQYAHNQAYKIGTYGSKSIKKPLKKKLYYL